MIRNHVKTRLLKLPLKRKMSGAILLTLLVVLMLYAATGMAYQILSHQDATVNKMASVADIVGKNCTASITFHAPKSAQQVLNSLSADPVIVAARIYDRHGRLFAHFTREGETALAPSNLLENSHSFQGGHLSLVRRIEHDGEFIATVQLVSNLDEFYHQIMGSVLALILLGFGCLLPALALSRRFVRKMVGPVHNLISTSRKVAQRRDYSLRAVKYADDDFGELTDVFNLMLERIQENERELEQRYQEIQTLRDEQAEKREKELLKRLSRSERMESLGVLAGGVAHDLNNIMGPLVGYPQLIMRRLPEDHPALPYLQRMQDSALKARTVIQDLLSLGRRGNYRTQPLQFNDVVLSYLDSPEMLELSSGKPDIEIRTDLDPRLPFIEGSAPHLSQVVMNFVINAYDAMDERGLLTLKTRKIVLEHPIEGYELVEPGEYVVFEAEDSGSGIDSKHLPRIFEPFYSRKQMGRGSGSGLGLAVVYGVVKDLGGIIDVRSRPGVGTVFRIYFPLARADQIGPEIGQPSEIQGHESVLVVDDVEEQRELAVAVLTSLGYQAAAVENGRAALGHLKSRSVDLIVLDMIMENDFDGLETFKAISRKHPQMPCVIASGFSESGRVKAALRLGAGPYLAKPYTPEALGNAVREALAGQTGQAA